MSFDLYINWKRFIYKSQTIYIFIVNSLYIDRYLVSHKSRFDLKKFVSSYFWLQNPFPFRCLFRIIPNSASLLKTKKFSNAIVLTGCPGADALNRFCGFIRASFFSEYEGLRTSYWPLRGKRYVAGGNWRVLNGRLTHIKWMNKSACLLCKGPINSYLFDNWM